MAGPVTRGRTIDGETITDIREARERALSKSSLTVADQIADAVVAVYSELNIPRLTLDRLAVIVDLDHLTVQEAYYRRLNRLAHPLTHKRCPRCGLRKSVDDYYKRRSSMDGLYPICKGCWDRYLEDRRAARANADRIDSQKGKGKRRRQGATGS